MIKAIKKTKRQLSKSKQKPDGDETTANHENEGAEMKSSSGEDGCFYNAVSKCMHSAGIDNAPSVQQLREECVKYAKENAWVKDKIIQDARKRSSSKSVDDETIWHTYWFAVRYTTADIDRLKISDVANDKTIFQSLAAAIKGRPEIEGQIICKKFGVVIHLLEDHKNKKWSKETIAIIDDGQSNGENRDESHVLHILSTGNELYSAVTQNHCCSKEIIEDNEKNNVQLRVHSKGADKTNGNTRSSIENPSNDVDKRLNDFTTNFVKEFEAKLTTYIMIANGEMTKFTKISAPFMEAIGSYSGGIIGGVLGNVILQPTKGSRVGSVAGSTVGKYFGNKVGRFVDKSFYKTKQANLCEVLAAFQKDKLKFRKILTEIGADIFQSFELQFANVHVKNSTDEQMQLLARDAMNRAVNYLCNNKTDTPMLTMHSAVLDGILSGKSKSGTVFGYEVANPLSKSAGFAITSILNGEKVNWNSGNLFEEVGIVLLEANKRLYYKQKNAVKDVRQYGYRRCFNHEKWEELKPNYVESLENANFDGYSYVLSSELLQSKVKAIYNEINASQMSLGELRIRELLEESQQEILDELSMLKSISGQLEKDSKILHSIEYNIKNLKFDEYFEKLSDELSEVLNEVKAGREENRRGFKHVNEKLDEIHDAIRHSTIVKSEDSVYLGVKSPSSTFTGRLEVLKQIQQDLENSIIVVIYGLGGVGKSEIVAKYVSERFNDRDSVIWINAETIDTIDGCLQRLAQFLGLKISTDDQGQQLNFIVNKIVERNCNRKLIVILDNASSYAAVQPFLSIYSKTNARGLQMIITTRNSSDWKSARTDIKAVQLTDFTRSEAVQFVQSCLSKEMNVLEYEINSLIDLLHGFPLALQQAIVYVRNQNEDYKKRNASFTITDYIDAFKKNPKKLLDAKSMGPFASSVYHIINFSCKEIVKENAGEKAILILKLTSFLASEKIPEKIFLNVVENNNMDDLIAAIKLLEMNSLVDVNEGLLSVHGLVQEVTRMEMSEQEERRMLMKVLRLLMKQMKENNDIGDYKAHILSIWKFACKHDRLIEKYVIGYVGNVTAFTPFLHLIVEGDQIEVAKEILNRVQTNHPDQLQKVINDKDKNGDRLLNYASKNQEMAQFLLEKLTN